MLRDSQKKFACYECDERFKTSTQLQVHLAEHDDTAAPAEEEEEEEEEEEGSMEIVEETTAISKLPILKQWKKMKNNSTGNRKIKNEHGSKFESWKKKKTNLYLNR